MAQLTISLLCYMTNPMSSFRYTPQMVQFLRDNYPKMAINELRILFNGAFKTGKTLTAISSCLNNNNIIAGRSGCFSKGNVPWNAGTKGLVKPNSSSFVPGYTNSAVSRPIGTERMQDGYVAVKIGNPSIWVKKHLKNWIEKYGPVPKAHYVFFKDRDKTNCELDNLVLVSASEMQYLSSMDFKTCPTEYEDTVLIIAKLQAKIKEVTHGKFRTSK